MDFIDGEANFFDTLGQKEGVFWVDNTYFISQIENIGLDAYVWVRPRRFGKYLFLNTLDGYYNVLYKNDFENNFGHLYIGKNPTPEQGSYHVLRFDFSGLDTKSPEGFEESLKNSINDSCTIFGKRHGIPVETFED